MIMHGFPVKGLRFDWDSSIDYTPSEQIAYEKMLLDAGYEIDKEYFNEKYNVKITGKKEPAKPVLPVPPIPPVQPTDKTKLNFFQ